ncbi:MAG: TonB-dependent receptor [Desulfobacterales bacterium]|nr:TonB-dependent receptor [Desulfobacterales bacterium]
MISKIKKAFVMLLLLEMAVFPLPSVLSAQADKFSDEEAEREIINKLEKMNSMLSETKMNADFVPGTITVLHGSDLESRGFRTVGEAMTLVPGVELITNTTGIWETMTRGVNRSFSYGNFKTLLNGFPLNKVFWISPLPNMLIEQVERIEIIRGPGSAIIYGESAMSGAVNIITREKGSGYGESNRIFAGLESNDTYKGGGVFSWFPNKDFHLAMNIAGMNTKGPEMETGPDLVLPDMGLTFDAPDFSNENTDYGSGFFTLKHKDTFIQAHFIEHGQGDFFRFGTDSDDITFRTGQWGLDMNHTTDINISSLSLQADFRIGWQNQKLKGNNIFFAGYKSSPGGLISDFHYKDRLFHGGVDLKWNGCPALKRTYPCHKVLFGWSFASIRLGDIWYGTDSQTVRGEYFGLSEGTDRLINSLTLRDEFHITRRFTLTTGLRYDHYDDSEDNFSPHLAAVFRLDRKRSHLLKAQYARSFRPPTFDEMYGKNNPVFKGNPDLKPETSDTFEIGYIYRGQENSTVARITLFYSDINDAIYSKNDMRENCGSASLKGVELEFGRQIIPDLNLDANISYADTEDRNTGREIEESKNWLANIGLTYQLHETAVVAVQYRHVGDSHRNSLDTRDELDGYNTVNITGSLFNLGFDGLVIRAGIKNLFDEDVRYPSSLTFDSNGSPIPTYPEDLPRPGREWWMQLSYGF